MQVALVKLLGIATGAVDLLQKVFSHRTDEGNFETMLETAQTKGKNRHEQMSEQISLETDSIGNESFAGSQPQVIVSRFIDALKGMGISSADIRSLLSGDGQALSDTGLRSVLSKCGLDAESLNMIMSDDTLKADIKIKLADAINITLRSQICSSRKVLDNLITASSSDEKEQLIPSKQDMSGNHISQEVMKTLGTKTSEPQLITVEQCLNQDPAVKTVLSEIIARVTQNFGAHIAVDSMKAVPEAGAKISNSGVTDRLLRTLKNTFDIKGNVLEDLFFADSQDARGKALDLIGRRISVYLSANHRGSLPLEIKEALSFLKTAMSDMEWADIESIIKLWQPNLALADAKGVFSKEAFLTLVERLGGDSQAVLDRHTQLVMDQLRRNMFVRFNNNQGQFRLKLNPPMLGRVDVNLKMHNGTLEATFRTDQSLTRDILQQNIHVLRESLAEQGIRINNFTFLGSPDERTAANTYTLNEQDRQNQGEDQKQKRTGKVGHDFQQARSTVYSEELQRKPLYIGGLDIFA